MFIIVVSGTAQHTRQTVIPTAVVLLPHNSRPGLSSKLSLSFNMLLHEIDNGLDMFVPASN